MAHDTIQRSKAAGRDDDGPVERDYSRRNRKFEWRDRWFHLHRSRDDVDLERIRRGALLRRQQLIDRQRANEDHRAAHAPAGPGTPWFSVGPRNVNGRVKSIVVHPGDASIVYAGAASGGVWKTTDGGQSWRPLWHDEESLAVGSIAIAPSSPTPASRG